MRTTFITVFLTLMILSVKSQTTSDTRDFSTDYYSHTDGGGTFSSSGGGLGLWQTQELIKNVGFLTSSVPMNRITVAALPAPD